MNSAQRRTLRYLSLARMVSVAGTETAFIALIALMFERTGSVMWASFALLAMIGTGALASPFAGMLGDRFDRRRVMIGSDLGAAACFAVLPFVHAPWVILTVVVLAAAAESPFIPASNAAVPLLVPAGQVTAANAQLAAYRTIGHLSGPVIGGVLVATVGASTAFAVNAVSFVLSALLVLKARGQFSAVRATGHKVGRMLDGFRFARQDPVLRILVVAWGAMCLGFGLAIIAEFPLAEVFGVGSVGYGLIVSAFGIGSLIGAKLATRARRGRDVGIVLTAAAILNVVGFAATAMAPMFALVLVGMIVVGTGLGVAEVIDQAVTQERVPERIRSRTLAATEALAVSMLGVAIAGGGPLIELIGARWTYACAAGFMAIGVVGFARIVGRDVRPLQAGHPSEAERQLPFVVR